MYFAETIKNAQLLKRKREEHDRSLSTTDKLTMAEDFLKNAKDLSEYQEMEQTVKQLNKTLDLERKGFVEPQPIMPKEELDIIFGIAEQETIKANEEYQQLQEIISRELQNYLAAVSEPLTKMLEIEQGFLTTRFMSSYTWFSHGVKTSIAPFGGEIGNTSKIINTNNRLKERVGFK